jgi:hypothetical protein
MVLKTLKVSKFVHIMQIEWKVSLMKINDSETKQQYNINVFEAKELKKERLKTGDEN